MRASTPTTDVETEIARYLRSGDYGPDFRAWPGNFLTRARTADADLKAALIAEIRRRSAGTAVPAALPIADLVAFTRQKLEPMVRGLFPGDEQEIVLAVLEKSIVFVGPDNVAKLIEEESFLGSAYSIGCLFLTSIEGKPVGPEGPALVGISDATTCYLTADYWRCSDPFADFLVHEAAHVFHSCKRERIGLRETRRREWLLNIDFSKRETFAYCCEAYSRVLELSASAAERRSRLEELSNRRPPPDDRIDGTEYLDILAEAVAARNGWKRILARCAPRSR